MRKMKKCFPGAEPGTGVRHCGRLRRLLRQQREQQKEDTTAQSDLAKIQAAGVLKVGITEYEPMNYKDKNGEWTGFDTEFAQALGEKLGVKVQFVEINWNNKYNELSSGAVDCLWNGMTITDEGKKPPALPTPMQRTRRWS